jgi:hypothetical protein
MSNLHHRSVITRLQHHGRWLVDASPSHIRLTKTVGNQACSVILERQGSEYVIKPVTYPFKSVVSHFDYNQQEERWARNKNAFKALVQTLKKCEIWGDITNQDFIQINENNKKSKKTKVKNELSELLGK